jgi:hypothetical protein
VATVERPLVVPAPEPAPSPSPRQTLDAART